MQSLEWVLIQHDWYLFKGEKFGHRHKKGEYHVKMKSELYKPRDAKNCQKPLEAQHRFFLTPQKNQHS